ncbi:MAG: hypothetical protein KF708_04030 [Pirellulales bacterium]|nr:hypothetical protein [Pirellulales bacterium]
MKPVERLEELCRVLPHISDPSNLPPEFIAARDDIYRAFGHLFIAWADPNRRNHVDPPAELGLQPGQPIEDFYAHTTPAQRTRIGTAWTRVGEALQRLAAGSKPKHSYTAYLYRAIRDGVYEANRDEKFTHLASRSAEWRDRKAGFFHTTKSTEKHNIGRLAADYRELNPADAAIKNEWLTQLCGTSTPAGRMRAVSILTGCGYSRNEIAEMTGLSIHQIDRIRADEKQAENQMAQAA